MKLKKVLRSRRRQSTDPDELDASKHGGSKDNGLSHQSSSVATWVIPEEKCCEENSSEESSTPSFTGEDERHLTRHMPPNAHEESTSSLSATLLLAQEEARSLFAQEQEAVGLSSSFKRSIHSADDDDQDNTSSLDQSPGLSTTNLLLSQQEARSVLAQEQTLQQDTLVPKDTTLVHKDTASCKKKKVRFSTIQFREYPIELGDSPAVSRGAPLTIGWDHLEESIIELAVDDYEMHATRRVTTSLRDLSVLKMSSLDRNRLLKRQGYSQTEIQQGTKDAAEARLLRQRTARQSMQSFYCEELLERTRHKIGNATFRRRQKQQERILLQAYCPSKEPECTIALMKDLSHRSGRSDDTLVNWNRFQTVDSSTHVRCLSHPHKVRQQQRLSKVQQPCAQDSTQHDRIVGLHE